MLITTLILMILALSLINILNEKGNLFYKDNRFWLTLASIFVLGTITSMVFI